MAGRSYHHVGTPGTITAVTILSEVKLRGGGHS